MMIDITAVTAFTEPLPNKECRWSDWGWEDMEKNVSICICVILFTPVRKA
jgi:hypothetical protein